MELTLFELRGYGPSLWSVRPEHFIRCVISKNEDDKLKFGKLYRM